MKTLIFLAATAIAAATPAFAQPATHAGHDMPQAPAGQQQPAADPKAHEHGAHHASRGEFCCAKMNAEGKDMNCHGDSQAGKTGGDAHQGHGMSH